MAKLTQQELERHLWGAADILRGTVDAGDYKQYIFGLLFYMDEKAAAYKAAAIAAANGPDGGREDEWFDLQRLTRIFIKVYADLSPDPAILDFTAEVKWAAAFLRLATQAIAKDESLDHRSYSGKIRDMLGNYPPPALTRQAETAPRIVWKGFAPDSRAVSTVVRKSASASAAHLAR